MNQFSIGEIAIYQATKVAERYSAILVYDGEEVEIISELGNYDDDLIGSHYICRFKDGVKAYICPIDLHKKHPPKTSNDIEETRKYGPGQWDLMPWSPKEKENVKQN